VSKTRAIVELLTSCSDCARVLLACRGLVGYHDILHPLGSVATSPSSASRYRFRESDRDSHSRISIPISINAVNFADSENDHVPVDATSELGVLEPA
jgi:hypothetical protein